MPVDQVAAQVQQHGNLLIRYTLCLAGRNCFRNLLTWLPIPDLIGANPRPTNREPVGPTGRFWVPETRELVAWGGLLANPNDLSIKPAL
jgi:hypothetical protein